MNVVMFSAEYFPPKKMNANHNRLFYLAQGLNRNHNVIIISPNNKYRYEKSVYKNIRIIRFPYMPIKFFGKLFMTLFSHRFVKNISHKENINIDILWYNSALSFMLSKKFKCIKIYDVMGIVSNEILAEKGIYNYLKSIFYKKTENMLYNNSSVMTTINELHKKILSEQFDKKIYVLRDAVDYELGINKILSKDLKNRYKNNFVLFFVGSLNRKRFDKNIDAFEPLIKKVPNIKIIIAGEGKYKELYEKEFAKRKIDKHVDLIGFVKGKELNSYIKLSDVCFSDVFLEGFPYKIFEYMCMGKVSLVEETEGIKEILLDRKNSLLYKNSKEFENKILQLIRNPELRRKIERNAKLESKNNSWTKREKEFKEIIKEIYKANKKSN